MDGLTDAPAVAFCARKRYEPSRPSTMLFLCLLATLIVAAALPATVLAQLPDGRVYEQVTPINTNGAVFGAGGISTATAPTVAGNGLLTYNTFANTLPDETGSSSKSLALAGAYVFSRAANGTWSYASLLPSNPFVGMTPSVPGAEGGVGSVATIAPDVSAWIVSGYYGMTTQMLSDEQGRPNLTLFTSDGSATQLTPEYSPAGSTYDSTNYYNQTGPQFVGAAMSPTYGHVVYAANAGFALATGESAIPAGVLNGTDFTLYDFTGGALHQLAVQPNGTPFGCGVGTLPGTAVLSADGTKIVFGAAQAAAGPTCPPPVANQLFLREGSGGGTAETIPLSVTNPTTTLTQGPDANCVLEQNAGANSTAAATFAAASADASLVFFTSKCGLTTSSNTGTGGGNTDKYLDLYAYNTTGSVIDGIPAGQTTDVTPDAVDANGADVQSVLGASSDGSYIYFTAHGSLPGTNGATVGNLNLYVWHAGSLTYLGNLVSAPSSVQLSSDGSELLVLSSQSLSGFAANGKVEAYVYTATGGTPTCVSCVLGVTPSANVSIGPNSFANARHTVFFQTSDALVAADQNTEPDVYEWENGSVYLISSGASASIGSSLLGASPDGDDVYISTGDQLQAPAMTQLAPSSGGQNLSIFDARVGGVAPPAPANAVQSCASGTTWTCQGSASAAPSLTVPLNAVGSNVTTTVTRTFARTSGTGAATIGLKRPSWAALRKFANTGIVRLAVRSSAATGITATATMPVRRGRRTLHVRVGKAVVTARSGNATVKIVLRLDARVRRVLHAHRTVVLTVRIAPSKGKARTLRLRLRRTK